MIQVEFWQLLVFFAGLLLSFFGAIWQAGKVLLGQFEKRLDERFVSHNRELREISELARKTDRDLLQLRADLPNHYVMRDDWIRFSGTIDWKLDGVHQRLDALTERIYKEKPGHARD
jgi:hypothetical protein